MVRTHGSQPCNTGSTPVEGAMKIFYSIAILAGTIIGAGIFALPYITMVAGLWLILGYFFLFFIVAFLIHYFFAELSLATPDFKRLPGFAKIYLGQKIRNLTLVSSIVGLTGVLLAYTILGGQFLYNLLAPYFSGNELSYTLLYFFLGSLVVFLGIKITAGVSLVALILFFIILLLGFWRGFSDLAISNLLVSDFNFSNIFLPYGVVLFSLWGTDLIPEIEELLGPEKKLLKKVIFPAILISLIINLMFIVLILGITGQNTTEVGIDGLRGFFSNGIISLMLFFGFLATFTSFIVIGLTLKKIFCFDLKINLHLSWFLACFPVLFLFLIGLQDYIKVIGFIGSTMLALNGILICLMYRKLSILKPKTISNFKKFLIYPLILIFTIGILYEIWYFFIKI